MSVLFVSTGHPVLHPDQDSHPDVAWGGRQSVDRICHRHARHAINLITRDEFLIAATCDNVCVFVPGVLFPPGNERCVCLDNCQAAFPFQSGIKPQNGRGCSSLCGCVWACCHLCCHDYECTFLSAFENCSGALVSSSL